MKVWIALAVAVYAALVGWLIGGGQAGTAICVVAPVIFAAAIRIATEGN